eukprot:356470-Chlamydomonas_euryale.AAC.2
MAASGVCAAWATWPHWVCAAWAAWAALGVRCICSMGCISEADASFVYILRHEELRRDTITAHEATYAWAAVDAWAAAGAWAAWAAAGAFAAWTAWAAAGAWAEWAA